MQGMQVCANAAEGGHLEVLKWLRAEGCPWDARVCANALEGEHLEVLEWLLAEGCPYTRASLSMAVLGAL